MLETVTYTRKPFNIEAVRVTEDNIEEVATWCDGKLRSDTARYIKVRVYRPADDSQTKAYVGDWVLYAGSGYKVYTDKAFKNSFVKVSGAAQKPATPRAPRKAVSVNMTHTNSEGSTPVHVEVSPEDGTLVTTEFRAVGPCV